MALLRRAPREVYRVFDESDFLAGGAPGEEWEPVSTEAGGSRRFHRIAGAAMFAGAVAAMGAVLVLHRPASHTPGRSIATPASVHHARGARPGSPSYAAGVPEGSRATGRAVAPPRAWRTLTAAWSVAKSFVGTVPAPPVDSVAGAEGSPQLERAEFGFER
jgi:hypothetical protein